MAIKIKQGMSFDNWREAWFEICRKRGHSLRTNEGYGGVDQFVTNSGYHNGPGCTKCGWTSCMHCDWEGKQIPECKA